jgi:hypothetical protein
MTTCLSNVLQQYDLGEENGGTCMSQQRRTLLEESFPRLCSVQTPNRAANALQRSLDRRQSSESFQPKSKEVFFIWEEEEYKGGLMRKGKWEAAGCVLEGADGVTETSTKNTAKGGSPHSSASKQRKHTLASRVEEFCKQASAGGDGMPNGSTVEEVTDGSSHSSSNGSSDRRQGEWKYFEEIKQQDGHGTKEAVEQVRWYARVVEQAGSEGEWLYTAKSGSASATAKTGDRRRRQWKLMTKQRYGEEQRFSHFWTVDINIGRGSDNKSNVAFQQMQSGRPGNLSNFDADLRDDHGNTLLHYACFYGSMRAIKQLALNPALNQRNKYGRLPIWWAVQRGNLDAALWLFDSLANLDLKTSVIGTRLRRLQSSGNPAVSAMWNGEHIGDM